MSPFLPAAECSFPAQWHGRWFQSGVPKLISISGSDFETKGGCIQNEKDKYLIEDRNKFCSDIERVA
ncbi:1-deoxy-D-xylulose 5-phosphate reductoisomerase [Frankliniella fusca]|uniref:1-deoxy-D-xylulose 5-phosphate reductoisomerase n=1 Tax=Frankliniella fusca TaxID=407009 RepID=A0AAE1LI37_9NEOP|nr:1-deoxy-D-xylulose 5-phosphate reductoisomerase [Frankliniella fusca]